MMGLPLTIVAAVVLVEVDRDHLHVGAGEAGVEVEVEVDQDQVLEEEDHLLDGTVGDLGAVVSVQAAHAVDHLHMV